MHYHRQHRYGNVSFVKQNKTAPKYCIVEQCGRRPKAKSLCEAHYARFKRQGQDFDKNIIRRNKYYSPGDLCIIPKCAKKPHALGMCKSHYSQQKKHQVKFEDILHLFEAGCETCGSTDALSIDHDHDICPESFACEKCFRGILCGPCNRALGIVKEDEAILKNMIKYLQK
jgi:hypothetical protein